ncbi:predicted protein [Naegleria gruberi]|uniref:Predicted protein n=1 Tax=Naegleria gruberi TaxID=5762 RepID=D2VRK0_NAEGR|nr:uncharacterized protein NAEGRDRAFT_71612 [Naegleria gruberi]EFC40617.1 predicted protein [Naegleria gruberi]|eukprot:XP_002673361.1 predicted protein [Naegleria gruberi strain NEG-M]
MVEFTLSHPNSSTTSLPNHQHHRAMMTSQSSFQSTSTSNHDDLELGHRPQLRVAESEIFDQHLYPPNDDSSSADHSPTPTTLVDGDDQPTRLLNGTSINTTNTTNTATGGGCASTTIKSSTNNYGSTTNSTSNVIKNVNNTNTTNGNSTTLTTKGRSSSIAKQQPATPLTRKAAIKQYFQRKYLSFEHHLVSRSAKHRDSEYRSQLELITAIDEHCDSVLHTYSSFRMFILSLMGGIYVSIATLLTGLISSDISSKAMQKFMTGIAFVGGFTMIIFSKSILFTEVNISVSVHLFKNDLIGIIRRSVYWVIKGIFSCFKNHLHIKIRRPHKSIKLITLLNSIKLWSISIVGNILGTVMMSAVLGACFSWYDSQSMVQYLSALTKHKLDIFIERGASGWFSCLLSGMVANFMIGVASLLCTAGTTIIGKILALFFPIIAFAALGVQHAPANVGYFSHIFIWDSMYGNTTNLTITPEINYVMNSVEWYDGLAWNLIPAAIGNALGGFFLAFVFVFVFIK